MKKIITFLIRYPVWVSVLLFSTFIYGMISVGQLRYSFFPEAEPDTITVEVAYPGASPDEIAEGVTLKIEENLDGLQGVERVTSVSMENFARVTVESTQGSDIEKVLADVKNAIDRINSFPVGAEKPVIYERKFMSRTLIIMLHGGADLHNLKYIAEDFRDELLNSPNISQVNILGLPDLEFSIEVSESNLRRYSLSFDEIAAAVQRANVNISGGKFETAEEEMLIRAWGRDYYARELLDVPIRGNADGTVIYLKDVASVEEQWEDTPDKQYYNGEASLALELVQTEDEDLLAIAEVAKKELAEFNEVNTTVQGTVTSDATVPLKQRLELMVKNGFIGLILIVLALGFFLNLRLSFWVALSIPFSFAGMFVIASFVGITINVMSLFGMIIVIGILVDDGIVVGENIFSHYERGKPALQAAIDGTREVAIPVMTSVMTTVIIFTAFFFLDGRLGIMIWQMALVVISSLVFSLIEAFLILPSHLAHSKGLRRGQTTSPLRQRCERIIKYMTHRMYAPALKAVIHHKWITMVVPAALLLFTYGLIGGGLIGVTFFPDVDGDTVPINITLTSGSQEAETNSLLAGIEQICWKVNEELKSERSDGRDVIIGIRRNIGSNSFGESGSHTGALTVELLEGETRDMESYVIGNRIREAVGEIPEAQNISYSSGGHWGKPVSVSLLGNDFEQMDKARNLLKAELENFSSLKDVTDSDQEGRREVNITLKPRAHALGLTLQEVAGQVRQGFYGQEIQRIQRGRDEIRVWVRYADEDRAALGALDDMRIRSASGEEYPFSEIASYEIERGVTKINHLDRKREIKVEANQRNADEDLPPILDAIETEVLPRIMGQVQGVKASFEGQSRQQKKMTDSIKIAFPAALLGMFVLVILVFRSYGQALIIFSLIPLGILGAAWGHGFHGMQLNMLSLIGIIALSGIIINDSIVFVDQVNRFLREGQSITDAAFNAGIARFRPILLTSLTTSLGLAPLIMETSRQAQFLIPMAVSVAYGLIFGTFILLLVLPALVVAFNRIRVFWDRIKTGKNNGAEAVEPAVRELETQVVA